MRAAVGVVSAATTSHSVFGVMRMFLTRSTSCIEASRSSLGAPILLLGSGEGFRIGNGMRSLQRGVGLAGVVSAVFLHVAPPALAQAPNPAARGIATSPRVATQ